MFYIDKCFEHYSLSAYNETYETFSQRFARLHPGYLLDEDMNLVAGPTVPTINLNQLVHLLKSRDDQLWARSSWIFNGNFRYLDG